MENAQQAVDLYSGVPDLVAVDVFLFEGVHDLVVAVARDCADLEVRVPQPHDRQKRDVVRFQRGE